VERRERRGGEPECVDILWLLEGSGWFSGADCGGLMFLAGSALIGYGDTRSGNSNVHLVSDLPENIQKKNADSSVETV